MMALDQSPTETSIGRYYRVFSMSVEIISSAICIKLLNSAVSFMEGGPVPLTVSTGAAKMELAYSESRSPMILETLSARQARATGSSRTLLNVETNSDTVIVLRMSSTVVIRARLPSQSSIQRFAFDFPRMSFASACFSRSDDMVSLKLESRKIR